MGINIKHIKFLTKNRFQYVRNVILYTSQCNATIEQLPQIKSETIDDTYDHVIDEYHL